MMKSGRNQNRYMGLKALFVLLLTMGLLCGVAEAAEEYAPLKPADKYYNISGEAVESREDADIILHKWGERIGPDEWKVDVSATINNTAVEPPELEVVFVLDTSNSMLGCPYEVLHDERYFHYHDDTTCPFGNECTITNIMYHYDTKACEINFGNGWEQISPNRYDIAIPALNELIGSLPEDALIHRVVFSVPGYTETVPSFDPNRKEFGGATYLMTGVNKGITEFAGEDTEKILVIVTDGEATHDENGNANNKDGFYTSQTFEAFNGTVFTVGFTHDDPNLKGMVKNGGSYYTVSDPDELTEAFHDIAYKITAMVVDPMGTQVNFDVTGIEADKGNLSTAGDTIYWKPDDDQNLTGEVVKYSYKVKLNDQAVTDVVATYSNVPLNKPTSFRYYITSNGVTEEKSLDFPIPQATYAIGSLQVMWVDENGNSFGNILPEYKPTEEEYIICDYEWTQEDENAVPEEEKDLHKLHAPDFQTEYENPVGVILANGTYYEYVNTTYTADSQDTDAVDPSKPVAYVVTHHYAPAKTEVTVTKNWNDANNRDGIRPERVSVQLKADGNPVGDPVELNVSNNWSHTWTQLDKYADNTEIEYTVAEVEGPGYTTEITGDAKQGYVITNTRATAVRVTKNWNDANNQDGIRPESVSVQLKTGEANVGAAVELNQSNNWTYTWTGLDKYAAGAEIVYTVEEVEVPGYTTEITGDAKKGYVITNTRATAVRVTKSWNDVNNQDGIRPVSVSVQLKAGEANVGTVVELNEGNNWTHTWTGLDKYAAGVEIAYTVAEVNVPAGYTAGVTGSVANGYVITNTHAPAKTEVTVTKSWNDAGNQDGIRPESVNVQLKAGEANVGTVVELNEGNNWTHTWTGLDKYAAGAEIAYAVAEVDVPAGYTAGVTGSVANGYVITNTHVPAKTAVTVTKNWNDANNQDGIRPASVSVQLKADGEDMGAAVVLNKNNNWTYTWEQLNQYYNGNVINYTVEEAAVPEGYTAGVTGSVADGFVITNTHAPAKTAVTVTKSWNDANNQDGIRPESVSVQLKAGTQTLDTVVLNTANNWSHTWTNLNKYVDGVEITYTVAEVDVPAGYKASVTGSVANGYVITNTHVLAKTAVTVTKSWNDANNQDGKRPASVKVQLKAGTQTLDTVVLNKDNEWKYTWTGLNKYVDGVEIAYTVTEETVPGYKAEITGNAADGYVITNTHEPEKTAVKVEKVWDDEDNQDGIRPESVSVQLKVGEANVGAAVELDQGNNWTHTWTGLDKYAAGVEIAYAVAEVDVPAGYTAGVTGSVADGFVITNTHEPQLGSLKIIKKSQGSSVPDDAEFLISDAEGDVIHSVYFSEFSDGEYVLNSLPAGRYTVQEVVGSAEVDHYTLTVDGNGQEVTVENGATASATITNIYKRNMGALTISKTVEGMESDLTFAMEICFYDEDGNELTESFAYDGDLKGTLISGESVSLGHEQSITFEEIPTGTQYTVTEAEHEAFTASVRVAEGNEAEGNEAEGNEAEGEITLEGSEVEFVNTVHTTDFEVTKIWDGGDGEISLTLYANGKMLDPQPACIRNGNTYTYTDLPVCDREGNWLTYSAKEKYVDGFITMYLNEGEYADESSMVYDGGRILNRAAMAVSVRKIWKGMGAEEARPQITLTLYRNGEKMNRKTPEPDAEGWYTFDNLPTSYNGKPAVYTVQEEPVKGFITTYINNGVESTDCAKNGGTIVNYRMPETGDRGDLAFWMAMLAASGAMWALVTAVCRRKRMN